MRDNQNIIKMIRNREQSWVYGKKAQTVPLPTWAEDIFLKQDQYGTMWIHVVDCSDSQSLKAWSFQYETFLACSKTS